MLSGLGPQAAATCLAAGRRDLAVELFEQGRGVLFAQALDVRTDLTALACDHPDLAAQFSTLAADVEAPVNAGAVERAGAGTVAQAAAERRRQVARQLDQLIRQIRALPGFGTFALPRPAHELQSSAAHGPVVLLNVATLRSDALILKPDSIDVVELPGLSRDSAIAQAASFLTALDDAQLGADPMTWPAAEAGLAEVLGWLWDTVTGPVLGHLGITTPPGDGQPWPHLHWCPSGPLAFLPLHAAGYHGTRFDERPSTVVDLAVSSTIPTVRALLEADQAPADPAGTYDPATGTGRVLVVTMPVTPGQSDLPGAADEADVLCDLLPGQVDVLGLPDGAPATHDEVIHALPGHVWAHFSCHGVSDMRDPSASSLLLQDYQSEPLTVLDLGATRPRGASLAFLSACTTARAGVTLPDEPIHLAAACLLAGYSHVVATLWPISDRDAVNVTRAFYTTLSDDGAVGQAATPAAALHKAVRQLRLLYPDQPSRWAAHTHTGPSSTQPDIGQEPIRERLLR